MISTSVVDVGEYNRYLSEGSKFYRLNKRMFDIICALSGLIILAPLFLITAVLIKLEDIHSPVFFSQERVGKNEKRFRMYKFRSMVTDAEVLLNDLLHLNEAEGAMFKIKGDPRVTKIGKFIRATSIDELPQLLNVLKGDMSLVGPRPPLVKEVEVYTEYEKQRLIVIPGCTGLWQATERNNVGFKGMVKLDLLYIQKKSLIFDVVIIFKTILSLVFKRAY
ncbi:sugar transferase [Exiguobacterium sp. s149]|uniref:sugar transferase n=1 Tax=Exiguobacterium TaxID=33986 RepID=UPI001BEBCA9D|nr:sugar transferase [Exiguobacterium sp. s149]